MICNIQINIICLINLALSIPSKSGLFDDEQRLILNFLISKRWPEINLKYCLRGFVNNDPISIGTHIN